MGKKPKHSKTGETKMVDGLVVYEWSNGDWRYKNGRIYKSPNTKSIDSPERGAELQRMREEKREERIAAGAAKYISEGGNITATRGDVVEAIGYAQMALAVAPEEGRASTEAAKFLMAGMGDPVDMRAGGNTMNIGKIEINVRPEVEDGLDSVIEALDGMYTEVDDGVPF